MVPDAERESCNSIKGKCVCWGGGGPRLAHSSTDKDAREHGAFSVLIIQAMYK